MRKLTKKQTRKKRKAIVKNKKARSRANDPIQIKIRERKKQRKKALKALK